MIPTPWVALVLALGTFRLVRLVGWDDLPPIVKLRARATGERVRYNDVERQGPIYTYRRPLLAHFIGCPFCQGFWVSAAVYGLWLADPRDTLYVVAPFALSAFVGLLARNLDP